MLCPQQELFKYLAIMENISSLMLSLMISATNNLGIIIIIIIIIIK